MLHSKIRRGELDREITFIKKSLTVGDANADHIASWVEIDTDPTVSARKRDLSGQDIIQNDQIVYSQRTEWTVDYRTDITTDNRLVFGTQVYNIIAIAETDGRERYLTVMTDLIHKEVWT